MNTDINALLEDGGLILAFGTIKAGEAAANTRAVVAQASAGAVSARLVAVPVQGVSARGALLQVAGGASVTSVAEAADVLHGVPGLGVGAAGLGSQVLLGPAGTAVIAVVGAQSTLASNTVVTGEAVAGSGRSVAGSLVGAFYPRMQVVGVYNISDPSKILGAGALGAVGASPFGFAVKTGETLAVIIGLTCSMI